MLVCGLCMFTTMFYFMYAVAVGITIQFADSEDKVSETRVCSTSDAIFNVSGYLRREADKRDSGKKKMLHCEPAVFNVVSKLLGGISLDEKLDVDDVVSVLLLTDILYIQSEREKASFYQSVAQETKYSEDFRERMEKYKSAPGIRLYMLQLLIKYAKVHEIDINVYEKSHTFSNARL